LGFDIRGTVTDTGKDTSSDGVTSIRANREYTGPQKPDPVGISLDQEKPAKLAWFSVL
jgi:hypothetical protein